MIKAVNRTNKSKVRFLIDDMFVYSNVCLLIAKGLLRDNWMTVCNYQHKYTVYISTMVGTFYALRMPVTYTEVNILSLLVYWYPLKSVPTYFSFHSLHWTTFIAYEILLFVLIFDASMKHVRFTDCISKPVLKIDTVFPSSRAGELLRSV